MSGASPLDPERWRRIEALFQAAVELPPEARAAYLAGACGDDLGLRAEVDSLLRADAATAADSLGAAIRAEARYLADPGGRIGTRIGPYRIDREIGRGGMGTVFLAVRDDLEFEQRVALKLLRRGLETTEAVARFRDERQLLAALEHPGIVRLLDGGSAGDGLPYLVMEYVEGEPITDYCESHHLSIRARLELFGQVCAAVQFAHQRLVVHRDLKPSNILVGADGVPKLLDFGIAKLLGSEAGTREARTRTGMHLFTPEYGSPEQARAESITVATDVYSLGAVLYELLCGERAHRLSGGDVVETLRVICEREPPRPSTVAAPARRRALAGDLDNIVLKALQKEPARRYASVEQLAEDVRRHLDGRPVLARAGTWSYRASKFVRRRRVPIAIAAAVATALGVATVVSLEQARRAERRFEDVRHLANSLLFEVDEQIQHLEGATAARELIVSRARQYLDRLAAEAGGDATLAREVALAYLKTGDILANPRGPNLGRPREAIENYSKARAMLEQLLARGHEPEAVSWSLARVLLQSGEPLSREGDPAAGRDAVRRAVRLVESLPESESYDYEVALLAHLSQFEHESAHGVVAAVAGSVAKAQQVAERWSRTRPSARATYWLGICLEAQGALHFAEADPEGAAVALREARRLFTELVEEHPEHAGYRRELWLASIWEAKSLTGVSELSIWNPHSADAAAGEATLERALELAERLFSRDSLDQRAASEVAGTLTPLAVLRARRSPAAALPLFERALAIWEAMPTAARAAGYFRQFERFTRCSMAEPLAQVGRLDEARAALRAGRVLAEQNELAPGAGVEERAAHLSCRYQGVRALRALGDSSAEPELAALIEELRALQASHPQAIEVVLGLSEALRLRAELRPGERCPSTREAIEIWRQWPGPPTAFTGRVEAELEAELAGCPQAPGAAEAAVAARAPMAVVGFVSGLRLWR